MIAIQAVVLLAVVGNFLSLSPSVCWSPYKDEELWLTVENRLSVRTSICTFLRTKGRRKRERES
jgi:hypothetical protein